MNVLSLFSGIGGLDLGLQRAGMTIVGQVEIDPWCRKVLAKHWPEVPKYDDVRTCAQWWGDRPSPDLVCGGFPCQPVSSAGKRLAQDDPRWLWPAMAEVIRRLRPRYALMENVPGLLVRGMGDVLGDLAACGYDAEWDCIPACAVGAPHRRDRVWIVAYPRNRAEPERPRETRRQAGERPSIRHVAGNDGQDVADAAGAGSPDGRTAPGRRPSAARRVEPERLGSHVAHAHGERTRQDTGGSRTTAPAGPGNGTQRRRDPRPDVGGGSPDMADATFAEWRAAQPQHLAPTGWRASEPRERDSSSRPIGDWWATEPDVGRVAHGIPRRVDRLRGLGNAVVPQVAEHIGRLIMGAAA